LSWDAAGRTKRARKNFPWLGERIGHGVVAQPISTREKEDEPRPEKRRKTLGQSKNRSVPNSRKNCSRWDG